MITIVGTGKVGSAAAFDILKARISDVIIIDLNAELATNNTKSKTFWGSLYFNHVTKIVKWDYYE